MKTIIKTTATTDAKIIKAAIDLIGVFGYKGTTTRQIADRAKVDEVTLFRKFGSKEALAKSAVVLAQSQIREALSTAGRERTGEFRTDLTNLAFLLEEILERNRESVVAIMFEAKREAYFAAAISGMVQFILNYVRQFLDDFELQKRMRKSDLEFITISLVSYVFFRIVIRERLLDNQYTKKNRKQELAGYIDFLIRDQVSYRKKSTARSLAK